MVEQRFCKPWVAGSNPVFGSINYYLIIMAEDFKTPSKHLCTRCNSETEKGLMTEGLWYDNDSLVGINTRASRFITNQITSSNKVTSYKCLKCGYIDNFAEPD